MSKKNRRTEFWNKLVVIAIVSAIVFGLLGYFIGLKVASFQKVSKTSEITTEKQVQKTSEELVETLRNISETIKHIENILRPQAESPKSLAQTFTNECKNKFDSCISECEEAPNELFRGLCQASCGWAYGECKKTGKWP